MRPSGYSRKPMLSTIAARPYGGAGPSSPSGTAFRGLCSSRTGRSGSALISRRGNDLTRLCPGVSILGQSEMSPTVLEARS
jgi:hypothetical protein